MSTAKHKPGSDELRRTNVNLTVPQLEHLRSAVKRHAGGVVSVSGYLRGLIAADMARAPK